MTEPTEPTPPHPGAVHEAEQDEAEQDFQDGSGAASSDEPEPKRAKIDGNEDPMSPPPDILDPNGRGEPEDYNNLSKAARARREKRSRRIQIPRELRTAASLRAQAAAEARWGRPQHARPLPLPEPEVPKPTPLITTVSAQEAMGIPHCHGFGHCSQLIELVRTPPSQLAWMVNLVSWVL